MKDELCEAFCGGIRVRNVPVGLAVSTGFKREDGDSVGFYVVQDKSRERARLEDDGDTIPYIEACGVDLSVETRADAFDTLLREYGARYDTDTGLIFTEYMDERRVPGAAIKFVALLLRVRDLLLLTPERVASTFRADALAAINRTFDGKARIEVGEPLLPGRINTRPDVTLRSDAEPPLAIFLGTSEIKVLDATVMRMETEKYLGVKCKVVLLLEELHRPNIRDESVARAMNLLDFVGAFRGNESEAMARLEREFLEQRTIN